MAETRENIPLAGNFKEEFPLGAVVESAKVAFRKANNSEFGIVTVDGKPYSVSKTATISSPEMIEQGKVTLPAKIRMEERQGKQYNYYVPVLVTQK